MPELPEVETVRRGLSNLIVGRRVAKAEVLTTRLRYPVDAPAMVAGMAGQDFVAIRRRGKYLIFEMTNHQRLLAHLGMTGRFHLCQSTAPREPHLHALFQLDQGQELRFIDPRRFGMLKLLQADALEHEPLLTSLGPEPLSDDFDCEVLMAAARGSKRPLKTFIMDSQVVVGVGNIYASESLWRAGIHPNRAAGRLAQERAERLVVAIKEVLTEAIKMGGTTLKDFAGPEGAAGYFKIDLAVYDREGEPCKRCQKPILRRVHSNRSTFYCSLCQR